MAQVNKFNNFLKDEDGVSAKDYLMLIFTGVYLLQQVICFILALCGMLPEGVTEIVDSLDAIVITIIGGVFSITAVQAFRKPQVIESEQTVDLTITREDDSVG